MTILMTEYSMMPVNLVFRLPLSVIQYLLRHYQIYQRKASKSQFKNPQSEEIFKFSRGKNDGETPQKKCQASMEMTCSLNMLAVSLFLTMISHQDRKIGKQESRKGFKQRNISFAKYKKNKGWNGTVSSVWLTCTVIETASQYITTL